MSIINKNCGIYKITSPSGRIYIGQTINIERRWSNYYSSIGANSQPRLKNSFKKYGVENHQFDIIEYCLEEELNCSERFWQDEFDVTNKDNLNCSLTKCGEKRYKHSEETRKKISELNRGKKLSDETKEKLRIINAGENSPWFGKNHTDETKRKIGDAQVGFKNHMAKLVLNIETGIFYDTAKEAAESCGMHTATFNTYLTGKIKNKSISYIYV
jgi:group I intron endonuclease